MLVPLCCVPSMALILLVQVQSRVFTAKCSEHESQINIVVLMLILEQMR